MNDLRRFTCLLALILPLFSLGYAIQACSNANDTDASEQDSYGGYGGYGGYGDGYGYGYGSR